MRSGILAIAGGVAALFLASTASAVVIQTFGPGSAVTVVEATADFEDQASLFGNPYVEGGMSFSRTNLSFNNNGCGFAGCPGHPGFYPGFLGNYIYGVGAGGFFTIEAPTNQYFTGLEFMSGTGFSPGNSGDAVFWEAYRDNVLVGTGSFAMSDVSVIGFSDAAGFNELRYTRGINGDPNFQNSSNAPALDQVRAQFSANVPEPATLALLGLGLAGLGFARGRR